MNDAELVDFTATDGGTFGVWNEFVDGPKSCCTYVVTYYKLLAVFLSR